MVTTLYGEKSTEDRVERVSSVASQATTATKTFEEYVRSRREFEVSYSANLFYTTILSYCCCCLKSKVKAQADKYRKFQIAVQRLSKEQDIQYLIEMNRITRLLHKNFFLARQRRAVSHAHKYVISDRDLSLAGSREEKEPAGREDPEVVAQRVLREFDPENDKMDRRILFEVTGLTFY